jgi:galactose mutarotase-like enzyme
MRESEHGSQEGQAQFNIETRLGPKGSEVSFSPERGGIVTSLKLGGREVLYMDQGTFNDASKSVKGGIPIMFPNAGPLKEGPYKLEQHGFARDSKDWQVLESNPNQFTEELLPNDAAREAFPFDHSFRVRGTLEDDGSFTLAQEATNLEESKDMPVSSGLHPYFPVPVDKKKDIKFMFPGGEIAEQGVAQWEREGEVKTIKLDNPKVQDSQAVLRVEIPELGTLVLDVSKEYQRIWVWSQAGKDFICIEPVMRDAGGLVDDPELVPPQKTLTAKVNFRLE